MSSLPTAWYRLLTHTCKAITVVRHQLTAAEMYKYVLAAHTMNNATSVPSSDTLSYI